MKKILILFFGIFLFCITVQAQSVVFINAGSRAGYGRYQELTIEANGACRYYLWEVNGGVKDSLFFQISRQQLDSFFRKVEDAGFFDLNANYNGGKQDGAGIYISVNHAGRKHSVSMLNTDQAAVHDVVSWLNRLLLPQKIRIYYGQKT